MRNRSALFNVYFAVLATLTAAATVLRTVALMRDMNYASGHFNEKLIIGIADKLLLAAVIIGLSYAIFAKKGRQLIFDFASPLNYVFSGTLGAAMLLFAGYALSQAIPERKILLIITAILAVISTVHFVLASLTTKTSSAKRADFGIITVIFFAAYAAFLYFDTTLPINSPIKIIDEMTYIASSLFFLYETRISIGREKWPRYTALCFTAAVLSAYSAIPALILYAVNGIAVSNSIFETVLTSAILLFTLARLALAGSLREKRESETVSIIKAAAERRSLELADKPVAEPDKETEPKEESEEDEESSEDYYGLNFDDDTAKEAIANNDEKTEITE